MANLHTFVEYFIPLFVAIDAFGLIPLFLSVTSGMTPERRRQVTFEAVAAATLLAIGFMFLGKAIFDLLGISADDFRIAGGILLLVLAVWDLLIPGKPAVREDEMVGVVPLAMPLIVGPATMTTILVLSQKPGGKVMTAVSLAVNLGILLAVMLGSTRIARIVGVNTLRAISKLVMLLLAAIGVNFIRMGIKAVMAK